MQFKFKCTSILMAMFVFLLVACNKESAMQPTETQSSQMALSKSVSSATSTELIIGMPPPPPPFPIAVRSINVNCTSRSLTARTSVVLETASPYNSYSATKCYRFWYRRVGTTTWQFIRICNRPQNLFNLNLAVGRYELIVGHDDVTTAVNVRNSAIHTFTVVRCLTELAEF